MEIYELAPNNGRQSFYGKAKVYALDNGDKILQSYDTIVLVKKSNGDLFRTWDGWSSTTGAHIKAFCGDNKAGIDKLALYSINCTITIKNGQIIKMDYDLTKEA